MSDEENLLHSFKKEENLLQVMAFPLPERPLCPGFYLPIYVHDPKILAALLDTKFVGAFLEWKNVFDTSTNSLDGLKGKELLKNLYDIGSLARISSINGNEVILTGHARIKKTEMVSENPLTVKFTYLKDKPFDMYNYQAIRATFLEASSVLRTVLSANSVWKDHLQHIRNFKYTHLADFGAAIPCAQRYQAQYILHELDVHKRLQWTLRLAKIQRNHNQIQGIGMKWDYSVLSFPPVVYEETPVGVAMGLAYNILGGSARYMVTQIFEEGEGIGCLHLMGQVWEDTKESARIAYILAQQILHRKQPDNKFFANSKLCLNLIASRGSSAGCTILTSLLSLAMNKPVKRDLAMTGVITLTGRILPIGRVKEKTIAAKRNQAETIILPKENQRNFEELEENVKQGIKVHYVDEYEQIFKLAF